MNCFRCKSVLIEIPEGYTCLSCGLEVVTDHTKYRVFGIKEKEQ